MIRANKREKMDGAKKKQLRSKRKRNPYDSSGKEKERSLARSRTRERENERAPYVPICLLVVSGSCGSLWWLCMFVYEKTRKQ